MIENFNEDGLYLEKFVTDMNISIFNEVQKGFARTGEMGFTANRFGVTHGQ
ncbi:hypothetical protein ACIQ34_06940 [Ureibacillus sp. NPDC094379]